MIILYIYLDLFLLKITTTMVTKVHNPIAIMAANTSTLVMRGNRYEDDVLAVARVGLNEYELL